MSILKRNFLLNRFLGNRISQDKLNTENVMATPSIVINDTVSTKKKRFNVI